MRREKMKGYLGVLLLVFGLVCSANAQQVDSKLVGTWETHDGPCGSTCTLTIDSSGKVSFAAAGSAVQVVFSQFTPGRGIDLIFPLGGKAEFVLSKSNVLMGFYTPSPSQGAQSGQSTRFVPVAFMRK